MTIDPLDDYPLGPEERGPGGPSRSNPDRRVWGVAALLLIAAAAAVYFATRRSSESGGTSSAASTTAEQRQSTQSERPLGPGVEPRELPPLDLTDPVVRDLLSALSSRPELAAWLASEGLIRNLAASIDAVARGATPSPLLRRLAPSRPFTVDPRGGGLVIAAQAYQRYDGIGDTVAALDASGIARAYVTLRPRLQEAYRELGYPDANIDDAVRQAIRRLLDTPLLDGAAAVAPAPVLYQYVDPRVERLSAAQKQLIRMGPRNQRLIQDKIREIEEVLGRR